MKRNSYFIRPFVFLVEIICFTLLLNTGTAAAQDAPRPEPTYANVPYGPHERNAIDFYKAASDQPTPVLVYFHGGGFTHGDKSGINVDLLNLCTEGGIAVAAINYRFSQHAIYSAQMHDAARAIQFLRSKADEWHLDPSRIASFGGSAGAGISLWLGFHDEMADPDSVDPIARLSTRLTCAIGLQAQCTYDPREVKKIVPGKAYNHGDLKRLYGKTRSWDWDTDDISPALSALLIDASPITHLTKDDCPVFLYHREDQTIPGNIHHGNMGRHLKNEMDALQIECVHYMSTDLKEGNAQNEAIVAFVKKHFVM
jgi:acetyl esterase